MDRLGFSIGSFAPAVGLPGRGHCFNEVAEWLAGLRQQTQYWLQGFPLRGCCHSLVEFDSVEGPWCGMYLDDDRGWRFRPEKYHSLKHRLQAMAVLRLYERPYAIANWLRLAQSNSARVVNRPGELNACFSSPGCQTWLELNPGMGCSVDELTEYLESQTRSGAAIDGVVYDTLHVSEIKPALSDAQLMRLAPYIRLFHWQPSRVIDRSGKSEIREFLNGKETESVRQLRYLRLGLALSLANCPVLLEPSLHHWRQLGGPRDWLSVTWITQRLIECTDQMKSQLA